MSQSSKIHRSGGHSFIRMPIAAEKRLVRRLLAEYHKLKQVETEDRFLLDYCFWFPERYVESPPRFNNTTTHQPNQSKRYVGSSRSNFNK